MTTLETQLPSATRGPATTPRRQLFALLRMELTLLRRSWSATAAAVLLLLLCIKRADDWGGGLPGATRVSSTIAIIGVLFVHHHLASVYASRRQDLVLKRLRSGTPSDATIMIGTASSTVMLYLLQSLVLLLFGIFALDLPAPVNPLTMLIATVLGAAIMTAFAALMSAITRAAEAAMLTTLPTMGMFMATPGILIDYGKLPADIEQSLWFSPLGPLPELLRVGWLGQSDGQTLDFFGTLVHALPGFSVMAGWILFMAWVLKRWFRWEPRQGK